MAQDWNTPPPIIVNPSMVIGWLIAGLDSLHATDPDISPLTEPQKQAILNAVGASLLESVSPGTEPKDTDEWWLSVMVGGLEFTKGVLRLSQERQSEMLIRGKQEKYDNEHGY